MDAGFVLSMLVLPIVIVAVALLLYIVTGKKAK